MPNYFSDMLGLTKERKIVLENEIRDRLRNRIVHDGIWAELDGRIQTLWMYDFFECGEGYSKFKPHLIDVFEEVAPNPDRAEDLCRQYLQYIGTHYCRNGRYDYWFYKNCWMISGKSYGQTSRMPRAVLHYYEDLLDQRGYDEDDYDDYPYFQIIHNDEVARDNFLDVLDHIDQYDRLRDAIARFRTRASAECGWYLEKNGGGLELILGIKRIRLSEGDPCERIRITVSAQQNSKNDKIEARVARGHDNIRIAVAELLKFKGKGPLSVSINGQKIDDIKDLNEVLVRFQGDAPICFKCPVNPNYHWFKLLPEQYEGYNKPAVWIASVRRPQHHNVLLLQVDGRDFFCYRQELELGDVSAYFEIDGTHLFSYRRSDDHVDFTGSREDVCEDARKWTIFSGPELKLTCRTENVWNDDRNRDFVIKGDDLVVKPESPDLVQRFEVFRRVRGAVRKFRILYIPDVLVEQCRRGEAWADDNGAEYRPEEVGAPEVMLHMNGGRFGDLTFGDGTSLKLFVEVQCNDVFFWLKKRWSDIEQMDGDECRLRDFDSYEEMNGYSLCFVGNGELAAPRLLFQARMHDGKLRVFELEPSRLASCRHIMLTDLTGAMEPTVADGFDEVYFNGQRLFRIQSRPDSPQIFRAGDKWRVFMPERHREKYRLIVLSEKALESFTDLNCIGCGDWREEMVPIAIPEKLAQLPHAVYAALINTNRQINSLLDIWGEIDKLQWVMIRGAVETDCRNLFSNKTSLEIILNNLNQDAVFRSAREFVKYPDVAADPAVFWEIWAGRKDSPTTFTFTVPYIMKYMLENGYNFLAEPDTKRERTGRIRSVFYPTWLSTAFRQAMVNCTNTPQRQMTQFRTFSNAQNQKIRNGVVRHVYAEPNVVNHEDFLKIFIGNRDDRCMRRNPENWVHGKGWLPVALFQYLLEERRSFGNSVDQIGQSLEQCGLREVTTITDFAGIWNFGLRDDEMPHPMAYVVNAANERDDHISVAMPTRQAFLDRQSRLYNTRLDYLNDLEAQRQLFTEEEFDATCDMLESLLNELDGQNPATIAMHLRICFSWILENIRSLVEKGEEDLNHAVMGITAIVCRLSAQAGYRDVLSQERRDLLLANVKKAFDVKYKNSPADDGEDAVPHGDCWRFLMHYIPPVDLVIWFYNSFLAKQDVYYYEQ